VWNYNDDPIEFVEPVTVNYGSCLSEDGTETFWRKKKGLTDTYTEDGGLTISVPGPILKVDKHALQTSSVIADALLGQGEALDCYNQKAQDAEAMKSYIENMAALQQIETVQMVSDPEHRAAIYKKIFGDCCDVPQVGCDCAGK